MWWDILPQFCCKFPADFDSERILKISYQSYERMYSVAFGMFLTHSVYYVIIVIRVERQALLLWVTLNVPTLRAHSDDSRLSRSVSYDLGAEAQKANVIASHAVEDSDAIVAASRRHDRDFLHDVATKLVCNAVLTPSACTVASSVSCRPN